MIFVRHESLVRGAFFGLVQKMNSRNFRGWERMKEFTLLKKKKKQKCQKK